MCGFSDVRQRANGHYYCTVCGRDLGKEFDVQVALYSGKAKSLELSQRCARSEAESRAKKSF